MTSPEQQIKQYKQQIDAAKEFIKKYGEMAALAYAMSLPEGNPDRLIYMLALLDSRLGQK
jgi:hypothetical protein